MEKVFWPLVLVGLASIFTGQGLIKQAGANATPASITETASVQQRVLGAVTSGHDGNINSRDEHASEASGFHVGNPTLDGVLCRQFPFHFRVAVCSIHQDWPDELAPLCLWLYRSTRSLGDGHRAHPNATAGAANGGDAANAASAQGRRRNLQVAGADGRLDSHHAHKSLGAHHPVRCRRRLLQQFQQSWQRYPRIIPPTPTEHRGGNGVTVLTWRHDVSPYKIMEPRETLAYKAHITALQMCNDMIKKARAARTEAGGSAFAPEPPACIVVTDKLSWVAAGDGGAMERDLLRGPEPIPIPDGNGGGNPFRRSLHALQDAGGATADGAFNADGAADGTLIADGPGDGDGAVSAVVDTTLSRAVAIAAARRSSPRAHLHVSLSWRPCASPPVTPAAAPGTNTSNITDVCRVFDSPNAWLKDISSGIRRHLRVGATEQGAAGGGGGAIFHGNAGGQARGFAGSEATEWDVLALPSACAGWRVGIDEAAAAAAANRAAIAAALMLPSTDENVEAGLPVLPQHYTIAGCVLAFNPRVVRTLLNLSTEAASNLSSSAALFPMTNLPLFAKLGQLSRQGVIKMALATHAPATETAPATAQTTTSLAILPVTPAASALAWANALAGSPQLPPRRRFLLYTFGGDRGYWRMWAHPSRNYDLLVAYHGQVALNDSKFWDGFPNGGRPDHIVPVHGTKHQNLHRLHAMHPGIFSSYEAVAVWDDELEMPANQVSAMFEHFSALSGLPGNLNGLWVAQPSVQEGGKVDHQLLFTQSALSLAYTSFVDKAACVFRSDKLVEVLDSLSYTGELMGWGADYAYHAVLGPTERDRYAVMHDFQAIIPANGKMGPQQQNAELKRIAQWKLYAARFDIQPVDPKRAYKCVARDPHMLPAQYPGYCPESMPWRQVQSPPTEDSSADDKAGVASP